MRGRLSTGQSFGEGRRERVLWIFGGDICACLDRALCAVRKK